MEPDPKLSPLEYLRQMRAIVEATLLDVADAVNEAPPGHIISGSEEKVRDVMAAFQEEAYEKALQMRTDAAEAAFPPSEGREDG